MSYLSASDPKFVGVLERDLRENGELLLLIRYSSAAGSKEFELHTSFRQLEERLQGLAPRTCVIAFRRPKLPLRGIVDDNFIAACRNSIPDGSEFLILQTTVVTAGMASWFHHADGSSHEELEAELEDLRGQAVAAGLYPQWLEDTDDLIAAVVPDEDGIARTGIY